MTSESTLLALLESREAEANAKAEWIAQWVEDSHFPLIAGQLDTTPATLLAELNQDQHTELNQAIYLLLMTGDKFPIVGFIQRVLGEALTDLAHDAWSNHLAQLHDAMSEEQWGQYQFKHQRTAA